MFRVLVWICGIAAQDHGHSDKENNDTLFEFVRLIESAYGPSHRYSAQYGVPYWPNFLWIQRLDPCPFIGNRFVLQKTKGMSTYLGSLLGCASQLRTVWSALCSWQVSHIAGWTDMKRWLDSYGLGSAENLELQRDVSSKCLVPWYLMVDILPWYRILHVRYVVQKHDSLQAICCRKSTAHSAPLCPMWQGSRQTSETHCALFEF